MARQIILEACVENISQGIKAYKNGADRIELCENLSVGGTTPSYGTLKVLMSRVPIPVFPILRPRGGDFCYTSDEIEVMIEDLKLFKSLGIKGIVLGFLTENNEIDYPLLEKFMEYCHGLEVTFHKAIDEIQDPLKEISKLKEMGIKRILTSGKCHTALEGVELINKMIDSESCITIVSAGKISKNNLKLVTSQIKGQEFHGKLIVDL